MLVRPPLPEDAKRWRECGWRSAPDPARAAEEHEAFCVLLEEAGAEVVVSHYDPGNPDALYPFDPVLVGSEGAVLLRPGKPARRGEPGAVAETLRDAGVPVVAALREPAVAEGGDTLWLGERTLLVGIGYRTNREALPRSSKRSPASTSSHSTFRTGTGRAKSSTCSRSSRRSTAISPSSIPA